MIIALLWDESFLWGLMARNAMQTAYTASNSTIRFIQAEDIRNGALSGPLSDIHTLFVPGGWASNKLKALGDEGAGAIRDFVRNGGSYIGFCGGAGLATLDGIGLLNITRKLTKERVPSFSGRVRLSTHDHDIWRNIEEPVFNAWWPSQFILQNQDDGSEIIKALATYEEPLPDAFSSDICVSDVKDAGEWRKLEENYGINLDPARIYGEPAVVEGSYGKGKVILSLIHFDTPDDADGATVLKNILGYVNLSHVDDVAGNDVASKTGNVTSIRQDHMKDYLVGDTVGIAPAQKTTMTANTATKINTVKDKDIETLESEKTTKTVSNNEFIKVIEHMESSANKIIDLGIRNFLWFWRNPMLLQWRRGVRGLEYCTLYVMISEIVSMSQELRSSELFNSILKPHDLNGLSSDMKQFTEKSSILLIMEKRAIHKSHGNSVTYNNCDDSEITALRIELFGKAKSYGGLFKKIIDELDDILYNLLHLSNKTY